MKRPTGSCITYYEVTPPPFLTSKESFFTCLASEVSLNSRMNYIWSFISYLGSAQPPPSFCFYEPSFPRENFSPLGNPFIQTGLNLPPLCVCVCVCVCTYTEPLCPSTRLYHLSLDFPWEIVHLTSCWVNYTWAILRTLEFLILYPRSRLSLFSGLGMGVNDSLRNVKSCFCFP